MVKTRARNRRYQTKIITDEDYANDRALLTNTPVQAESLLQNLEQTARGNGLYVNSDNTEFMCFNYDRVISLLIVKPLKWVDQLIYLGSNLLSTEVIAKICIGKAWTAINKLWKANLW